MPGAIPSPISKLGHSKSSSASSPLHSLTSNSTADANSDWNSLGRQASPFQTNEAPTIPFLSGEHRRGRQEEGSSDGFGSFDLEDNDNDGLLGLEALRDRAYSSPGPVINGLSSSPPVVRGYFPAHITGQHAEHFQDSTRLVQRVRPPLSQPYLEGLSSHQGDRSYNPMNIQYASSSRNPDTNNISLDSTELRGLGAIGRPEGEFVGRRTSASEATMNSYQTQHTATTQEQLVHKFGTLPTLNSHLQYQRPNAAHPELQRPRHVRSVSQPVAAGSAYFPPGFDGRYYANVSHMGNPTLVEGSHRSDGARRGSSNLQPLSNSYDGYSLTQKGGNLPPGAGFSQGAHPVLQRRDALDFHVSPASTSSGSIIASNEDYRSFGMPSMISPGQSPQQVHYGSHSRQASDAASGMLSSSPMSVGSGLLRGQMRGPGDEDLTHPLVGENIEVPGELEQGSAYVVNPLSSQHVIRNTLHGHSHSLEQFPVQYMDASNPPTAGAALTMPRVVYSVKFKRTQRNFVMGPRLNRDLKIGTYVIVEADRGEDLGIVIGKAQGDKYGFNSRPPFSAGVAPIHGVASTGSGDLKRIIRLATHDEVSLLQLKREEEDELLKICRGKVRQRGLPMNVVDAEYQFDRHKLTFFFEAEGRVDFRELVRDLFSMYKTRIWMQQLDKNTSTVSPVVPQMTNQSIDFGTPIIAPASEFADSIVLNGFHGEDFRSH